MKPIRFENVSKAYYLRGRNPTLSETLGSISSSLRLGKKYKRPQVWALRNVSFTVERGEVLGIIGPNGAGKTTILRLLAGVTSSTSGRVQTHGRVAPLIALGAGFHPELTGRENINLNGIILGMTRREIERKFDAIVQFAELTEFLDMPVKRYSSGMYARLGFATAIYTDPDILLVDEVLAVGDWAFQDKCMNRMLDFKRGGAAIVFVSHNLEMVRRICDRVILLHKGDMKIDGNPGDAIAGYFASLADTIIDRNADGKRVAEIQSVELYNAEGLIATTFRAGDSALARMQVRFVETVQFPEFGFFIRLPDSLLVMSTGSRDLGVQLDTCRAGDVWEVDFPFQVNLLNGVYHLGAEVRARRFERYLDFIGRAVTLTVHDNYAHGGIVDLQPSCRVKKVVG